jgi:TonB family protein
VSVSVSETVESRFRPLGRGTFVGGVILTAALHVALAALVYFGHVRAPAPPPAVRDLMVTKLVHLGKPRDKFYLPRIQEPPPPKAPEPTIKVAENPNAAPAKKEPPRPPDPQPSKQLNRALERARAFARNAEEQTEGLATGSASGTATEASVGDEYATAVSEAVKKNWSVPAGLTIGEVINFEVEIRVSIAEDGTILRPTINRPSGNSLFDDSCMQAIQLTRRVPPPPASVRARFRRGVALAFGGKDLAR